MEITVCVEWVDSGFGYIIGHTTVIDDESCDILMEDKDMFFSLGKYIDFIVKKFRYNPRFEWKRMILHKRDRLLEMRGVDLKRRTKV